MTAPDRRAPRWRRPVAIALLLGIASGLGAWFIAAPLRATPARVVPEPNLEVTGDTPSGADGRAAASAVVAGAASAASAARETPASCGEDQVAQYRTPEPDADGTIVVEPGTPDPDGVMRTSPWQAKPAGVGYTGAMHRLDASLRASTDPFDRTLADWLNLGGIFGTPAARVDALVRDATTSDDPRVYGLAYQACHSSVMSYDKVTPSPLRSCAPLNAAEWARLDPGNAVPWVYALNRADEAGDAAAQRDAMDRIAASSRVDLRPFAGAAAISQLQISSPADLAAQQDAAMRAMSHESPSWLSLTRRCRAGAAGDAALASWCARVATLMFESPNYGPRAIGGSMHKLLTDDTSWLDRAHQDMALLVERAKSEEDDAPCTGERRTLKHFVRVAAIGEIGLVREIRAAASAASR